MARSAGSQASQRTAFPRRQCARRRKQPGGVELVTTF
jgi:hypothetical protein